MSYISVNYNYFEAAGASGFCLIAPAGTALPKGFNRLSPALDVEVPLLQWFPLYHYNHYNVNINLFVVKNRYNERIANKGIRMATEKKTEAGTLPISTRVNADVVEKLKAYADEREWSMSQLMKKILTEWAQKH